VPSRSPRKGTPEHARQILDTLERVHPEARCALDYADPFQLAVATILSAQCTDERVNQVTPVLFARFPDAPSLARASLPEVEEIIRSTGFFRSKARSVVGLATGVVDRHGGELPPDMARLVKLPGIGRKTANVILGHAFDLNEGIAVDTHVLRVAGRLGLVSDSDPLKVEARLMKIIPRERWTRTTDLIIFHGRKVCDARRPACGRCPVFALCRWESRQAWASASAGPPRRERSPSSSRKPTARRPKARERPARTRPPRRPPTRRRRRGGSGGKA
jgi:endonuclease-3